MTGKTHLACGLAATTLLVAGAGATFPGQPLTRLAQAFGWEGIPLIGAWPIPPVVWGWGTWAAVLILTAVGTLWPDLDSPTSELQEMPGRLGDDLGRRSGRVLGLRANSLLGGIWRGGVLLVFLPPGLIVEGLSWVIRRTGHHRGWTHTIYGLAGFTGVVAVLVLLGTRQPALMLGAAAIWTLAYLVHLLADSATLSGTPFLGEKAAQRRLAETQPKAASRYNFHLFPPPWRVRTGSWVDTFLVRGVAWVCCLFGLLLAGR